MTPAAEQAEQGRQALKGLALLLEQTAPWLVDVGTWVFGGLIALNLVIIAALITVGPVDAAVLISVTAFACALPLGVVGMILLRLSKDVDDIRLDDLTLRSFEQAHFPDIQAYFPPGRRRASLRKRRTRLILGYVLAIAMATGALTVGGIVAALWHMAPWVAETSLAAVVLSVALALAVMVHSMPPESAAERRLKHRRLESAPRDMPAARESERPK